MLLLNLVRNGKADESLTSSKQVGPMRSSGKIDRLFVTAGFGDSISLIELYLHQNLETLNSIVGHGDI